MSLKPQPIGPIPELTAFVARAALPDGNIYIRLRDQLGTLFEDRDFLALFPARGRPGLPPWRLALVTLLQFLENLSDRRAAEAVRSRIDWKYALGLELTDPGFDFSVLSDFRARLVAGGAEARLLDTMLERLRARGLVKARTKQRTDSTHVLAAIRVLNRLELVGETLRAALNRLAAADPEWIRGLARPEWFERYGHRVEDYRLPEGQAAREAYARAVGADGFTLLDALDREEMVAGLRGLPAVQALRATWARHYERAEGQVRLKAGGELPRAAESLESPYDPEARFSQKRGTSWTGYKAHLSETCEDGEPHLITHVETTVAVVQDVSCTATIHAALIGKGLPPGEHLVDAGYIDAGLLARSRGEGIDLIGPTRPNHSWQTQVEGAYEADRFVIAWEARRVTCPRGKISSAWTPQVDRHGNASIAVKFRPTDCSPCAARSMCTRAERMPRTLKLHPREEHEALQAARGRLATEAGKKLYERRAGVEGTLSQGIRVSGLRRARYRGLSKVHLQHVATAAALNLGRLAAWLMGVPQAVTRVSRFARLAPTG